MSALDRGALAPATALTGFLGSGKTTTLARLLKNAAMATVNVNKTIDGPVTRASISKALATMKPYVNLIAGSPYVFGTGPRHAPMQATKVMKLDRGAWTVETLNSVVVLEK